MTISQINPGQRIKDVHFTEDSLSVDLMDGRTISVPLAWYPRLLHATDQQRQNWKLAGGGFGIHWPDIDEDLSSEGLLRGAPAPRKTMSHVA
jgi:hypothetical protein